MKRARKFTQPMEHTGLPNTPGWAGYDYLQWTGDVHHPGLDYNWGAGEQDKGKPVFTIASGIVEKCIYWNGTSKGFGNHIFVKHILDFDYEIDGVQFKAGDVIYSHYCHLDTITVKEGQEVSVGQQIGTCGGSGGWPSHLHLELRLPMGKGYNFWPSGYSAEWISKYYIDPYKFIEDNKGENMSNELTECLNREKIHLEQHNNLMKEIEAKNKKIADQAVIVSKYEEFKKGGFEHVGVVTQLMSELNESLLQKKEDIKIEENRANGWRDKFNEFIATLANNEHLHCTQEIEEVLAQAQKAGSNAKKVEDISRTFSAYKETTSKTESDLNAEITRLKALLNIEKDKIVQEWIKQQIAKLKEIIEKAKRSIKKA